MTVRTFRLAALATMFASFAAAPALATQTSEQTAAQPAAFRSSAHVTRRFCGRCGTALTFESDRLPGEIDLTTASLDDPEHVAPRDHVRTASGLSWMAARDGLPRFPRGRRDEPPDAG